MKQGAARHLKYGQETGTSGQKHLTEANQQAAGIRIISRDQEIMSESQKYQIEVKQQRVRVKNILQKHKKKSDKKTSVDVEKKGVRIRSI